MADGDPLAPPPPSPPPPPKETETKTQSVEATGEAELAEAVTLLAAAESKLAAADHRKAFQLARRASRLRPGLPGLSATLSAARILLADPSEPYAVLLLPHLAPAGTVRRQYRSLARRLASASPAISSAAAEASRRASAAYRKLSDRPPTFWTSCASCRLFHEFDRRYVGYRLICPGCRKSFLANEVSVPVVDADPVAVLPPAEETASPRVSARKRGSSSEALVQSPAPKKARAEPEKTLGELQAELTRAKEKEKSRGNGNSSVIKWGGRRKQKVLVVALPKDGNLNMKLAKGGQKEGASVLVGSRGDDDRRQEGKVTALPLLVGQKGNGLSAKKVRSAPKGKDKATELAKAKNSISSSELPKDKTDKQLRNGKTASLALAEPTNGNLSLKSGKVKRNIEKDGNLGHVGAKGSRLGLMAVEDSDFYNFDQDRTERSFKKGQVWAVYDDDDGMPRHYGLIDEVISVSPFRLRMRWLDVQHRGEPVLASLEKSGLHISCGQFKVSRGVIISSVNLFSHVVWCERAARELYRIFPRKGSVWALYDEQSEAEERRRKYKIAVCLTSYSEMCGLSVAFLEKAEGYKTIFRRQSVGCHAVKFIQKDNVWLFSHQIPARKVSGDDSTELPGEHWELDPASLSSEMVSIGWK